MKIRQGFVSNSSSSSFCISTDAYKNVFEVAIAMIPHREWGKEDKKLVAQIRKAMGKGGKKNKQSIDPNTPISFKSCNYDTYIFKKDDYYLISTCNNHPFHSILNGQTYPPVEMQEELGVDDCWFEQLENCLHFLGDFWYPEHEILATPIKDYEGDWICKKHHIEYVMMDGKKTCPGCLKGKK